VLLITDLLLGIHTVMFFTMISLFLITFLGTRFNKNGSKWWMIAGSSLVSSVLFYLISNFGVWVATALYPKTLDGLLSCYWAAIPFFRTTLLSTLGFSYLFFFGYAVVQSRVQKPEEAV
jgi:hypothetical protein